MEKQVSKSDVFTKESLIRLQDKMRTLCIEEFNQVYNLDSTLKQKHKGRNRDIHVSDMDNYILSKEDKDSFIDFIEQVDNISKEYDKIQTLSNTLVTAHEQLKDKNNKIKTLTENNEALDLRIKTLNDTIKEKDNEMYDDNVLDDDDIEELDLNKEKDDFER